MSLKPWRELITPHQNVLEGTFQESEFAADLNKVVNGTAPPEYQDPSLFYNLGNTYFKAGELGRAILFYQKAKQLLPRDSDIKKNLAYAESLTIDKIEIEKPGFISTLWGKIVSLLTINELTILTTGIYFLLILSSFLAIIRKWGPFRKIMIQLIILFSILFILTGGILLHRIQMWMRY